MDRATEFCMARMLAQRAAAARAVIQQRVQRRQPVCSLFGELVGGVDHQHARAVEADTVIERVYPKLECGSRCWRSARLRWQARDQLLTSSIGLFALLDGIPDRDYRVGEATQAFFCRAFDRPKVAATVFVRRVDQHQGASFDGR